MLIVSCRRLLRSRKTCGFEDDDGNRAASALSNCGGGQRQRQCRKSVIGTLALHQGVGLSDALPTMCEKGRKQNGMCTVFSD